MFNEITKSIHAELYSRAVSPLMGSFVISWFIFNYRLIMLIVSDKGILEKYKIIDETLYPTECMYGICIDRVFIEGSTLPLISALLFIYIYPYIAKPVFKFARNRQRELREIKRKIDNETPLTLEESLTIRGEIYKIEDEFQRELSRKNTEIERLKLELQENQQAADSDKQVEEFEDAKALPHDAVGNKLEKLPSAQLCTSSEYFGLCA